MMAFVDYQFFLEQVCLYRPTSMHVQDHDEPENQNDSTGSLLVKPERISGILLRKHSIMMCLVT